MATTGSTGGGRRLTRRRRPEHALDYRRVPLGLRIAVALGLLSAAAFSSTGPTRFSATARPAPVATVPQYVPPSPTAPLFTYDAQSTASAAANPAVTTPGLVVAPAASALAADGIPTIALEAYERAADSVRASDPSCHLPWPLLAAIGRIESDHGRFAGAQLRLDGTSSAHIIGIPLNGAGTALIRDTDHGRLDGDPVYDRAVGPMQFIPSTWARWGVDGNRDGRADPFNIFDAALAAAHYLCAAGGDLSTSAGQIRAVLAYNHSDAYLSAVLMLEATYAAGGAVTVPVFNGAPVVTSTPTLPPVNPGPPPGARPPTQHATSPPHTTSPPPTRSQSPSGAPASNGGSSSSSASTVTATVPICPSSSSSASTSQSGTVTATATSSPPPSDASTTAASSSTPSGSPDVSASVTDTSTTSASGSPSTSATDSCAPHAGTTTTHGAAMPSAATIPIWLALAAFVFAAFRRSPARARAHR